MSLESDLSLNVHNPYSLHPTENPTIPLVSLILNPTIYNSWSKSMLIALSLKNKVEFVDGLIQQPTSNHTLFSSWKKCNDNVVLWLVHFVSTPIRQRILWMDNAIDILEGS